MIESRLDNMLTLCRWCQAQVFWATAPGGERIPFDVDPDAVHEQGNWAITVLGTEKPQALAAQPTAGQAAGMRAAGQRLYSHHALHCPDADKWHKVKEHGTATRRTRGGRR